jgi:hypothetical protein
VFGEVDLVDCVGPLDLETLLETQHRHGATADDIAQLAYRQTFAWVLERPLIYPDPIAYLHPRGAVIWVKGQK